MPRPVSPSPATRGKDTEFVVALTAPGLRVVPTDETITVATGGGTKGSSTIPVAATTNPLYAGQALMFEDATTGLPTIAILSADAAAGATSLTVTALGEAIPESATAQFPVRCMMRQEASISRSTNTTEIDDFDRTIVDFIQTSTTAETSLDGMYTHYDAGRFTLEFAQSNQREVYFRRTLAAPNANYTKGTQESGFGIVSSTESPAPNDGMVGFTASLQVTRLEPSVLPTPVA